MYTHIYSSFSQLLVGILIPLTIFYLITRTRYFIEAYTSVKIKYKDYIYLGLLFSSFGIFDIIWNYSLIESIVNMSFIYIIIVSYTGNFHSILLPLIFTSIPYFFITSLQESCIILFFNLTLTASSYFFMNYIKGKSFINRHIILYTSLVACIYTFYIAIFTDATIIKNIPLEDLSPSIILVAIITIMVVLNILGDIIFQKQIWEGITAHVTLDIVHKSLSILENGLDKFSAKEFTNILLTETKYFDFVAIVNKKDIIAISSYYDEDDFIKYLKADILRIILNGRENEAKFYLIKQFSLGILQNGNKEIIGYIIAGHILKNNIYPYESKIVESMAQLISEQLRLRALNEMEQSLSIAEIKALQAQIDSHFLFNALNTIGYYCTIDSKTAKKLINYLASYYRQNITSSAQEISIIKELQHVNAYVQIELARFGDKLHISYDLDDYINFQIPSFILQPLVENSIKHGLRPKKDGGNIKIIIRCNNNIAHIFVKDDGVGMTEKQIRDVLSHKNPNSIGLHNINKRLKALYGNDFSIFITSNLLKGTTVHIRIPITKETQL